MKKSEHLGNNPFSLTPELLNFTHNHITATYKCNCIIIFVTRFTKLSINKRYFYFLVPNSACYRVDKKIWENRLYSWA
jgi:hypothetical protein